MGKSVTPKYRVEIQQTTVSFVMAFDFKRYGKATESNLSKLVKSIDTSFVRGGVNFDQKDCRQVIVIRAKLINQKTGTLVAEYQKDK